jgi:hypothetical protein
MSQNLEYHRLFIQALLTTVVVETAVIFLVVRLWLKVKSPKASTPQLLFAGVFCSAGTIPYLWFVLPLFFHNFSLFVVGGEMLVCVVEAVFYRFLLETNWKQSALISLVCNASSAGTWLLRG